MCLKKFHKFPKGCFQKKYMENFTKKAFWKNFLKQVPEETPQKLVP